MRVAVMLGDGFEPVEAIAPVDILRRGGLDVVTVSVMPALEVESAHGIVVRADAHVSDVDFAEFDALVLPGGSIGVENLGACEPLRAALRMFAAEDRVIGAICAAPMVLADLGLLEGRVATCYPTCEENFPAGAYANVIGVQLDGNLVTASGPGQAFSFGFALLRELAGEEVERAVAEGMLLA